MFLKQARLIRKDEGKKKSTILATKKSTLVQQALKAKSLAVKAKPEVVPLAVEDGDDSLEIVMSQGSSEEASSSSQSSISRLVAIFLS